MRSVLEILFHKKVDIMFSNKLKGEIFQLFLTARKKLIKRLTKKIVQKNYNKKLSRC